jgi:hypothetical protein
MPNEHGLSPFNLSSELFVSDCWNLPAFETNWQQRLLAVDHHDCSRPSRNQ